MTKSLSFDGGSDSKESACNVGDLGLIPGLGRSPGEGNGNPLQYSCLENPMDGGAWGARVHGVAKSQTGLNDEHFHFLSHKLINSKYFLMPLLQSAVPPLQFAPDTM